MDAAPKRKRRKGGIAQRQAEASAEASKDSTLQQLLMAKLAQGLLSAALCHDIMLAAIEDIEAAKAGYEFPQLMRVAKIKNSKNFQRALDADLEKMPNLPKPFDAAIPLKGCPDDQVSSRILLPHEMFHAYFTSATGWTASVLPDPESLPAFWRVFRSHPAMRGHPLLGEAGFENTFIPLCMHGDEVPVQGIGKIWCHSALQFSWSSLMATAAGRLPDDTNVWIWGVFEKFVIPTVGAVSGTVDIFFRILRWSFQALYEGRWPRADWRGVPTLALSSIQIMFELYKFLKPKHGFLHKAKTLIFKTLSLKLLCQTTKVSCRHCRKSQGWELVSKRLQRRLNPLSRRPRLFCKVVRHS